MIETPKKCLNCSHAITNFENVHMGYCKFEYMPVIRCDCNNVKYICGCICAEMYCIKKEEKK